MTAASFAILWITNCRALRRSTSPPLGPGRTSIGTRINRLDYFTGGIRLAAFHRRALRPGEMMDWR
jgi:hypothetical protein